MRRKCFWGSYTGEEHSRRGLVVREGRLNRAYAASVRLSERPDPDAKKKKRVRKVEVDGTRPILVTPLSVVGPCDAGAASRDVGDAGRLSKRPAADPSDRTKLSGSASNASPSGLHAASNAGDSPVVLAERTASQVR